MCGRAVAEIDAIVEGTILKVCKNCVKFGDAIPVQRPSEPKKAQKLSFKSKKKVVSDELDVIVSDYGMRVKRAREKKGMKQGEVAKLIGEKESVVQKVESGGMEPPMKLAKKLEQFFGISLIEKQVVEVDKEDIEDLDLNSSGLTIGDLLKFKK